VLVQRIAKCKEAIAKDDELRSKFGLPTPSLIDYDQIHGLRPMKPEAVTGVLLRRGVLQYETASSAEKAQINATLSGKRSRGRGHATPLSPQARGAGTARGGASAPWLSDRGVSARGRGQTARGGRGGGQLPARGISARGRGGRFSTGPRRGYGRGFGGVSRSFSSPSGGYRYVPCLSYICCFGGSTYYLQNKCSFWVLSPFVLFLITYFVK